MNAIHHNATKLLMVFLVTIELVIVFAYFQHSEIHRQGTIQSWSAWRRDPSPQNEAEWRVQRDRLRRDHMAIDTALLLLFALNGAGIFLLSKSLMAKS